MITRNKRVMIVLVVFLALILVLVIGAVLDRVLGSYNYNTKSLEEYKRQINSTLSNQEFIEELVNQNLAQRRRISELEEGLVNKERMIDYLMKRLNMSVEVESSPFKRISRDDIRIYNDRIIMYVNKAFAAGFARSRSMYPFINENVFALEVKPKSQDELRVGDVIGFESKTFNTSIIHRIIDIGEDEQGWYAITKGDNNPVPDPGKVRFEDISGVLVGLIY